MSTDTEEIEIRLVLEAIYAKYGHDLRDYDFASIRRRIRAVLARSGLSHLGELQHRLLTDSSFFGLLLDQLTVQVTEMFRDPGFYRAFREKVVPILRTYPQLKIWHAGCASGEEVYTTAILLTEENLYERTQIYATDVSQSALDRAHDAIYPELQTEAFADNYVRSGAKQRFEDYYSRAYGCIAIREFLRKNVVFFQHDLVSDYALGEMHVIFCRNVLIYFQDSLRQRVLAMFTRALCRGGYLCLGASECLPRSLRDEFTEVAPLEKIYRYRGTA